MRVALLVLAAPVLLGGCDDTSKAGPADAGPVVTTPLGFRVDEKALDPKTRIVLGTAGESSMRVRVSTVSERCEDFGGDEPKLPPGEIAADFWIAPMWQADGTTRWGFHSAYITRPDRHPSVVRAALLDDVTVGKDEMTIKGFDIRLHETFGLVAFEGDLAAKVCPRVARKEQARPQPDLSVTVGGQPLVVTGATLSRQDDQLFLKLTRAPHDCRTDRWEGYDVILDLVSRGDPPAIAFGSLGGMAFEGSKAGSEGADKLKLVLAADLAAADEDAGARAPAIRRVEVDGTLDLEGLETKVKGVVHALDCRVPQ